MNIQDDFTFFAPELLKEELQRYALKIAAYTKLDPETLSQIETLILSSINFVSEESISEQSWVRAFDLTKDIDEDDTPFIALAIELGAKLWTGDKVLLNGLVKKGVDVVITTVDIKKHIK
jgi:predicted nucleic acid-binding protein